MATLQNEMWEMVSYPIRKHGLNQDGETVAEAVEKQINEMSNTEFLRHLSLALQEI